MIGYTKVYRYCRKDEIEKIENYELAKNDPDEVWVIHHRLELTLNGEFAHTQDELIRLGMLYHRPYYELIFLKQYEHKSLHAKANNPGKNKSEITRNRLSNSKKGTIPWNKGINGLEYREHFKAGFSNQFTH